MRPYEVLEQEWARFNNVDPAGMVACASGTAALHLALEAIRLPAGSQVIVPDFSMIACARAVTLAGLVPVFVDCDDRLLIDLTLPSMQSGPGGVKNRQTSAMMAVHIYGRRIDMDKFTALAEPRFLAVIEDLAEAHGVEPHHRTDAACWSFYRNKVVAGEEGGAVWFRNPDHAKLARQLRCLGFTGDHDYIHIPRGHNYRMSDLHADWILDNGDVWNGNANSLRSYKGSLSRRRELEAAYIAATPPKWLQPARDVPWVYDLRIPGLTDIAQTRIIQVLKSAGIEARHGFKPLSRQREYLTNNWVNGPTQADKAAREVITLPLTEHVNEGRVTVALGVIRRHAQ